MEIQKTSNSQSHLEKEEWNWWNQPAWLQALLQSHSHQDSMVLAQRQKYRSMEQNRKPWDKSTNLWAALFIWYFFIMSEITHRTHFKKSCAILIIEIKANILIIGNSVPGTTPSTLQARLQQYVNHELLDVQAGFRKGRGIANICWIIKKAREFQKNIYFCFIDYAKAFDCVDNNRLWKILKDGNTRPPDLPPEKSVCRWRSNS